MANESDKKLILSLTLDQEKFRTTRDAIVELTGKVKELGQELNKISFGGRGNNSLLGGMDTNTREAIFIPKAGDSGSGAIGTGSGGGGITSGVAGMANNLKSVANDAIQVVRNLTSEVNSAVDAQTSSLSRLRSAFDDARSFGNGGASASRMSGAQYRQFGSEGALFDDLDGLARRDLGRHKIADEISIGEEPWDDRVAGMGSGGVLQPTPKQKGFLSSLFGGVQNSSFLGGALSRAGAMTGLPIGAFAGGAAAGAAVVGGAYMAGSLWNQSIFAQANESIQLGNDPLRRSAMAGSSLGNFGVSMYGGRNLMGTMAIQDLIRNGQLSASVLGITDPTKVMVDYKAPVASNGKMGGEMGLTSAELKMAATQNNQLNPDEQFSNRTDERSGNYWFGNITGKLSNWATSEIDYLKRRLTGDRAASERQMAAEAAQQWIAAHPDLRNTVNWWQNNAGGALNRMRLSGRGGRRIVNTHSPFAPGGENPGPWSDPAGGDNVYYDDTTFNLGANSPFSDDEVAGAEYQLGITAGRGFRGAAKRNLFRQAGGMFNANETFAGASMFGNGNRFNDLIAAASTGSGQMGLLDTTAASQLGGMVARGIGATSTGLSPEAGLQGMLSAAASTSVGGGILNARNMMAGMASFSKDIMGGGLDPLQQNINMKAMHAAGLDVYQQRILSQMSPAEIAQYMRDPSKGSAIMKSANISPEQVGAYFDSQSNFTFSRFSNDAAIKSDTMRGTVAGVRQFGTTNAYMEDQLKGFSWKKDKKSFLAKRDGLVNDLGTALAAGNDIPIGDALGQIRTMMATDKNLTPDLKGGGAWAAGGNTTAQTAKDTTDAENRRQSDLVATFMDKLIKALQGSTPTGKAITEVSARLDTVGSQLVDSLKRITDNINKLPKIGE